MQFSVAVFVAAAFAGLANAYTQPVGNPEGNPISAPGLNQIVPEGEPFTITWQATTPGTVTLVLLQGPSTNVKPLYPIVQNYPNNGKYVWTPSTDLTPDTTHYGIQLIVDATGQYQYSTQFGISGPAGGSSNSAASYTASSSTAATYSVSSAAGYSTYQVKPTTAPSYNTSSYAVHSTAYTIVTASSAPAVSTYNTIPVPSTSATVSSPPAVHTGAAGKVTAAAGALLVGAFAVAMGL